MKKFILHSLSVASLLFFSACSQTDEPVIESPAEEENLIEYNFTVPMPAESRAGSLFANGINVNTLEYAVYTPDQRAVAYGRTTRSSKNESFNVTGLKLTENGKFTIVFFASCKPTSGLEPYTMEPIAHIVTRNSNLTLTSDGSGITKEVVWTDDVTKVNSLYDCFYGKVEFTATKDATFQATLKRPVAEVTLNWDINKMKNFQRKRERENINSTTISILISSSEKEYNQFDLLTGDVTSNRAEYGFQDFAKNIINESLTASTPYNQCGFVGPNMDFSQGSNVLPQDIVWWSINYFFVPKEGFVTNVSYVFFNAKGGDIIESHGGYEFGFVTLKPNQSTPLTIIEDPEY